ncbi:MAG TPA: AraC family transcriptional regulator, partial [Phycisphaerae bacterium]|nr:AraC family transcriptional regulator [Phycisphaerae bacterium]
SAHLSQKHVADDIERGMNYMEEHYGEDITRGQAADEAGMSESHFARLLKEKTGLSFTDFLNQVRLDRAAELLRKTDRGLMQIALDTGFSDQSYFTRVFRKIMKLTPGQYRTKFRLHDEPRP